MLGSTLLVATSNHSIDARDHAETDVADVRLASDSGAEADIVGGREGAGRKRRGDTFPPT